MFTSPDLDAGYRPFSTLAAVSFLSGLLAVSAWLSPLLVVTAIIGTLSGCLSVWHLRRRTRDVDGMRWGAAGLILSAVSLIGAGGWHSHRYAIEAPAGYEPVSLSKLLISPQQQDSRTQWVLDEARWRDESNSGVLPVGSVPDAVRQFEGRRIAVKIHADPVTSSEPVTDFAVTSHRSSGFGASVGPTDQLAVRLRPGTLWRYTELPIVVSGVFRIVADETNEGRLWLVLDDATVRPVTSPIGQPTRRKGC